MPTSTELIAILQQALSVYCEVDEPMQRVAALAEARAKLDDAYNEALAEAVIAGHSFREVGQAAGVAANSVSPRWARTELLSAYASEEGRVGATHVTIAQHELRQSEKSGAPLRFVPRKRTSRGES